MTEPIKLHCTKCDRRMDYPRHIDPDIPARVVSIESAPCDQCDNGDFGSETWYDADGNEVLPD